MMTSLASEAVTNKEQLYQSFWQSVKQQKFNAKKPRGAHFNLPPPPPSRLLGLKEEYDLVFQ